jgi:hypothetical protein
LGCGGAYGCCCCCCGLPDSDEDDDDDDDTGSFANMVTYLLDRMVASCNCDSYNTKAETDDFVVVMVRMDSCHSRAVTGNSCNNIIILYKWVVLYFVEDLVGNNNSLLRIIDSSLVRFNQTEYGVWLRCSFMCKLSGRRDGKTLGA